MLCILGIKYSGDDDIKVVYRSECSLLKKHIWTLWLKIHSKMIFIIFLEIIGL